VTKTERKIIQEAIEESRSTMLKYCELAKEKKCNWKDYEIASERYRGLLELEHRLGVTV